MRMRALGRTFVVAAVLATGEGARGQVTFAPVVVYPSHGIPNPQATVGLSLADMDGDLLPDLVGAFGVPFGIAKGGRDGAFSYIYTPGEPTATTSSVLPADIDDDADTDLLIFSELGIGVRLNDGAGLLITAPSIATNLQPACGVAYLLDGTPGLDLVTLNKVGAGVSVYSNTGGATFALQATLPLPAIGPFGLAVADMDGDQDLDLIAGAGDKVFVLLAQPTGFSGPLPFTAPDAPIDLAVGHLNGDALPDIVVAVSDTSPLNGGFAVFLNNGSSPGGWLGLGSAVQYSIGEMASRVALADFDADGLTDIATGVRFAGQWRVAISPNSGAGAFPFLPTNLPLPTVPTGLAAHDVDGDDDADLVALLCCPDFLGVPSGRVAVLRNNTHAQTVPAAFALAAPSNGAVAVPTSPAFSWNAAAGADAYVLRVAADPGFSTTVYTEMVLAEQTALTVRGAIDAGAVYHWRVEATNETGVTIAGPWSFTTLCPADCNANGVLTIADFACFQSKFAGGCP